MRVDTNKDAQQKSRKGEPWQNNGDHLVNISLYNSFKCALEFSKAREICRNQLKTTELKM